MLSSKYLVCKELIFLGFNCLCLKTADSGSATGINVSYDYHISAEGLNFSGVVTSFLFFAFFRGGIVFFFFF